MAERKVRIERAFEGESPEKGKVIYRVEYEGDSENPWEGVTRIHKIYHPIWPYGNYVRDTLEIRLHEDGMICFHLYTVQMEWYGTGSSDLAKICADAWGLEDPPSFLDPEELEKINSIEDVKKLLNSIRRFISDSATYATESLEPKLPAPTKKLESSSPTSKSLRKTPA